MEDKKEQKEKSYLSILYSMIILDVVADICNTGQHTMKDMAVKAPRPLTRTLGEYIFNYHL